MFNEKLENGINDQINFELYSSYIYLSMSAYFADLNLNGFAHWMRIQAQEEVTHAMKLYDFVLERGGKIVLEGIEKPTLSWESPLAAFKNAYKHEQAVTARFNNLMDLCVDEKDHTTGAFLQWFITEQIEEEANAKDIVDQLEFIHQDPSGVFMMNKELGQRVFVAPSSN